MKKTNNPLVSVIVTTKDEEKNIASCLESITAQTYPNIEMIVVDNRSTDKTKAIANCFTSKIYDFGPERSAQRNYGISKSSGKYILYLDADMILTPQVVEECVIICEKEAYAGLYIPEKIIGQGFWIRVRDFERSFYDGTVIDCVRFVPRHVFRSVKGFDTSMTGPEDWDFDKKVRSIGSVAVISSPLYHNEGMFDMKRYLSKKRYYCGSFDSYIRKWGRNDKDVRKQLGTLYRLFKVFVEDGKFPRLIRHPLLAAGMYWLRLKVGLNYIRASGGIGA